MALVTCPECGREISDRSAACVGCGAPLAATRAAPVRTMPPPKPERRGLGLWWIPIGVVAAGVLFLGLGVYEGSTPEGKDRADRRAAIDECWQEQGRKSLSPDLGRVVAGACERLERDFQQKYGYKP